MSSTLSGEAMNAYESSCWSTDSVMTSTALFDDLDIDAAINELGNNVFDDIQQKLLYDEPMLPSAMEPALATPPSSSPSSSTCSASRRASSSPEPAITASSSSQPFENMMKTETNSLVVTSSNVVTVTDLGQLKLPIPKLARPKPQPTPVLVSSSTSCMSPSQVVRCEINETSSPLSFVIKTEPTNTTIHDSVDSRCLRRQQRMIKNRESACLSRKRRKEHLNSLEEEVTRLRNENCSLKEENYTLRQRLTQLEDLIKKSMSNTHHGNDEWDKTPNISAKSAVKVAKKATVLLALVCFFSINATGWYRAPSSLTWPSSSSSSPSDTAANVVHLHSLARGRSLLWASNGDDYDNNDVNESSWPNLTTTMNNISSLCPTFLNESEALRLQMQLDHIFRHEPELNPRLEPMPVRQERPKRRRQRQKTREDKMTNVGGNVFDLQRSKENNNAVVHLVRSGAYDHSSFRSTSSFDSRSFELELEGFFRAIERQKDTFYVINLSGDHLLLPAINHNDTIQPRMSFLMPSISNESAHHVALMQIDCRVTNTKLMHINESDIPTHFHHSHPPKTNGTQHDQRRDRLREKRRPQGQP